MKKVLFILLVLVASMGFAQTPPNLSLTPVGSMCDLGNNAAATLLVPYFEVDSSDMTGMDTVIGLINVDNDPIVAHVTLWNVDSWAVMDFNIYMTGYDVATFSMRQILIYGRMPNNGCATKASRFTDRYIDCNGDGQYFDDAITHCDGLFSTVPALGCNYNMDIACYEDLTAAELADKQCKLSIGSYDGWNANYVGYITIDVTVTCNGGMQDTNANYFAADYIDTDNDGADIPDMGVLWNSNALLGDVIYYDYTNLKSDGVPPVHIEAFGETNSLPGHTWGMQPGSFGLGGYGINTFYFKYEDLFGYVAPLDAREQLPLRWGFRYIGNEAFDGGTEIDVWRSHNVTFDFWYVPDGPCNWGAMIYTTLYNPWDGTLGLPLPAATFFDEEEGTGEVTGGGISPPLPGGGGEWGPGNIPILETQRIDVAVPDWPLPAESGWAALAFDTDQFYPGSGFGIAFDQSWINVRYTGMDKYTVGMSAGSYLNGCVLVYDPVNFVFVPAPTH